MLCYIVTTMVKYLVIMITNVEIEFVTLGMFPSKASRSIGVVDGTSLFCTAWVQSGRHPNNLAHIYLETVLLFIYTVYIGQ